MGEVKVSTCRCQAKIMEKVKGKSLHNVWLAFPRNDVIFALQYIEDNRFDEINKMCDVPETSDGADYSALFQVVFWALEVYNVNQMMKIYRITDRHYRHAKRIHGIESAISVVAEKMEETQNEMG